MNHAELVMRRKQVREFIRVDPIVVQFVRKGEATRNPLTGGYIPGADIKLEAQTGRIVQNVARYTDGLVNSEAGDIPDSEYRLIGLHTMDIKDDDIFEWLGQWYEVTGINKRRVESVFAAIKLRGAENRG